MLDCTPGSCQVKDGVAQCCVAISSLLNKETGTDPLANKCVDKANDGRDVDYPSLELRETNAIIECKAVFKLLGGMASTLAAISFVFWSCNNVTRASIYLSFYLNFITLSYIWI